MKNTYPENSPEARKEARRKKRLRLKIMRISLVATVLLLLALIVALVVLRITGVAAKKNGTTTNFLAVKAVEVVGDTRYSADEIIDASGIYVGESLLALNKVQAHDALLQRFPYLDWVDVGNSSFSTVRIEVRETGVLCAVQLSDGYMIVGENNHALEQLEEENLPDTVRVLGAVVEEQKIGGHLLDERSLRVVNTLQRAIRENDLVSDITVIDMTEKTNIRLMWKDRIELTLGNETNLDTEVRAFAQMLPTLLKNNGETAQGKLDMTTYSDDNAENDRAIFTPGVK